MGRLRPVTIDHQPEAGRTPVADEAQGDATAALPEKRVDPPLAKTPGNDIRTPDDDIQEGRFRFYESSEEFLASIEARL